MIRKNILVFSFLACITFCFATNGLFEKYADKKKMSLLLLFPKVCYNLFRT